MLLYYLFISMKIENHELRKLVEDLWVEWFEVVIEESEKGLNENLCCNSWWWSWQWGGWWCWWGSGGGCQSRHNLKK